MIGKLQGMVIATAVSLLFSTMAGAQDLPVAHPADPGSHVLERSLEDLNMRGGDVTMPPFSDAVIDSNSEFRRALLSKGIALRLIVLGMYAQNTLQAPVPADQQVYIGQYPFENAFVQPVLTADLRQLHLHAAQLYMSGDWNWVSWEPAGPKAFSLWSLYLYKEFGEDRVEMKAGYTTNSLDFIGMQVGGSTANVVQGVYAILPYEAGMAYFPLSTPEFNLRFRGPKNMYVKSSAQRSFDAAGGPATEARNHTGLRFDPKGDKLLLIGEAGYRIAPSTTSHETWFRAGYMRNSTLYKDQATGKNEPGNFCSFALADYQLRQPDAQKPAHGLYLGGSAMTVPSRFNAYDRYFEARLYRQAPFHSRPDDLVSLVSSYTANSRFFTNPLVSAGKSVWRNSASLSATYAMRTSPGVHLSFGLSYIHGPAITPHVPDALTFTASYLFFL